MKKDFINKKIIIHCILIILIGFLIVAISTGQKKDIPPKTMMELSDPINISDEFPEEVTSDKQFANGNLRAEQIQINKIGDNYSITMEIHNNTDMIYEVSKLELILLNENGEIIISMICNINDIEKFIRVSFDTTVDISKLTNVIIRDLT